MDDFACRNSILMTFHYPDLANASDWFKFATWHNQLEVLPDLGSDTSSVWNFCALSSDIVSGGNQWWCRDIGCFLRLVLRTNLKIFWHPLICIKDPSDIPLTSISLQSERGRDLGRQFHHRRSLGPFIRGKIRPVLHKTRLK